MKINFTNRVNNKLRKKLYLAAHFYADKLGIDKKLQNRITINLFIRKSTERGSCEVPLSAKKPRVFDIILCSVEDEGISIFQTLAHEMVHLKQFALGELRMMSRCNKWHGKVWSQKADELDDYYDSPWEIEAFGREEGLYLRLLVEYKNIIDFI